MALKLSKEFRGATAAHNAGRRDAGFNENFNDAHNLGTLRGRALVRRILNSRHGVLAQGKKISKADIEAFYASRTVAERIDLAWAFTVYED